VATAGGRGPRAPRVAAAGVAPGLGEAPLPPRTSRPILRPKPSPAAPGPGHSWVAVPPTASGVRWWPSDQPRQPACSVYPPKVQEHGCANGQVESGFWADVPAAGIREGGSTHPIKARSNVMRTPQSHTALQNPPTRSTLEDLRMQAKLAAAWTSLMFFIIYIDYFHLYQPGEIDDIRSGVIFKFDISGNLMSIFFVIIAIPTLMIMLSMTLPARMNRVTNLVVSSLYSPLLILNFMGAPSDYAFYYALTIGVEMLIVAFILRSAWTWPRRTASPATPAASLDSEPLRTPQ